MCGGCETCSAQQISKHINRKKTDNTTYTSTSISTVLTLCRLGLTLTPLLRFFALTFATLHAVICADVRIHKELPDHEWPRFMVWQVVVKLRCNGFEFGQIAPSDIGEIMVLIMITHLHKNQRTQIRGHRIFFNNDSLRTLKVSQLRGP